jgi:hypothetical protein
MAQATITGVEELQRMLERGARATAKMLTYASKKGANMARMDTKGRSPVDTGLLMRSIKLKAEKRRTGKKVYQIKFIDDRLVKFSKAGKRSFYPASQEYGWITKSGNYHMPSHAGFFKGGIMNNRNQINNTIVNELAGALRALGW